jgi:predicted GNAT family acetyltransferase
VSDRAGAIDVRNDSVGSRLVHEAEGAIAQLVYDREGDRLYLIHTEVPKALGGRGIGGELVRAAMQWARADKLTIVPWCPYARRWLREHPDEASDVAIDWTTLPAGVDHETALT